MAQAPLDAIDRKILDALQEDARIPVATLAQQVGLSRHAVRHRIDRLEALKVITGYTVRTGERAADAPVVRAIIMVYRRDRMRGADVTSAITRLPEVRYCAVLSGEFDLLVHLEAASQERITEIWQLLAALPGVVDTYTSFVLSPLVDRR
jgi:Lrp/AsnC family transcriptional regulator, leucine-responsive regulatory protein